jgi:hypothetical protein
VDTNWINQIFAPLRDPKTWESVFGYSTKEPWFFTEFSFLAVFGVFLIFYAALVQKNTWRKIYLITFSLFFYYKSSGPFLGLFALMIVSDYLFALAIEKSNGTKKKVLLWLSLSYSLSFLLYFKYANFFIQNCNQLLHTHFTDHDLFLPIGISFYTFQSISYLMDVYRKEIPATTNVSDYAFYMTFFPHLVAGPIVRAKDFLPQIFTPQIINAALYKESLFRILTGLLKKLFIADYLGKGDLKQRPTDEVKALRGGQFPVTPFHWEIEYPEVFDRENPGVDAIVGNPPFAGKTTLSKGNGEHYLDWLMTLHPQSHGNADLVAQFFCLDLVLRSA